MIAMLAKGYKKERKRERERERRRVDRRETVRNWQRPFPRIKLFPNGMVALALNRLLAYCLF